MGKLKHCPFCGSTASIEVFKVRKCYEANVHSGGVKVMDYIKREDAINAIRVAYWDKDIQAAKDDPCIVDAMTDWAIRRLKSLPAADVIERDAATVYDYPLRDLEVIASIMRSKGIGPEEAIAIVQDARLVADLVLEDIGKIMKEQMESLQKLVEVDE